MNLTEVLRKSFKPAFLFETILFKSYLFICDSFFIYLNIKYQGRIELLSFGTDKITACWYVKG